jgi:DNA repair protein RAD16
MTEDDPSAKGLVFSQFTSMLDLCHFRLEKAGIKCVKLDGSMSMEHRDKMIQDFTNDPDVKVGGFLFVGALRSGFWILEHEDRDGA